LRLRWDSAELTLQRVDARVEIFELLLQFLLVLLQLLPQAEELFELLLDSRPLLRFRSGL
jgi:hypothetical protein